MLPAARSSTRRLALLVLLALAASCDRASLGPVPVEAVRIVEPPASLQVGESVRLSALVLDPSDDPLADVPVYWGAVDPTVVYVDSVSGVAHALAPGTTTVVASSKDKRDRFDIVVPQGPMVAIDALVADELSTADDVDEFRFQGMAGQEVNVLLQGTSTVQAHHFRLRLIGPAGNTVDTVSSRGNDAALRRQAINLQRLPEGGPYRLRIEATLGADKGTYRFMVQSIHPAPEAVAGEISVGSIVEDEPLAPGDVDTYTFTGTQGQEISVGFEALSKAGSDALRVRLLAPNGNDLFYVQSHGDYKFQSGSGRIILENGVYTARVEGVDPEDQGAYRLQIARVARKPETAGAAINPNLLVNTERLDPVGDVDEFSYPVAAAQEVNVYLQAGPWARTDTVRLHILTPGNSLVATATSLGGDPTLEQQAIAHLHLPAFTVPYRVRVEGSNHAQGAYGFVFRRINLSPEVASAPVSYNREVNSESISPVGDVDHFTLQGTNGDNVRFTFQATSGKGTDALRLYVYGPDGVVVQFLESTGDQLEVSFDHKLTQPGPYRIRVQGVNSSDDAGSYRFKVSRLN